MQSIKFFLILACSILSLQKLFAGEDFGDYVNHPDRFVPNEKVGDALDYLNSVDVIRKQFNIETIALEKLDPALKARTLSLYLPELWHRPLGHGVLVNVGESAGIVTAAHVYGFLCTAPGTPTAIFSFLPDHPSISLSCAKALLLNPNKDVVLWKVDIASELLSQLGQLDISVYEEEKTERGLELCNSLSSISPASETILRDKVDYIETDSFLLPGCSGSGLFANNRLIGVFKGFAWESKSSLFEKLDKEMVSIIDKELSFPLGKIKTQIASVSRGDPLDGGLTPGFISLHFMMAFQNRPIPSLRPSDGLMQLPDGLVTPGGQIPVANQTFFDSSRGLLSSREILPPEMVFPADSDELKENGWPVSLRRLNCLAGKTPDGKPCYESGVQFKEQFFFLWDIKQDEGVIFPPADFSQKRNMLLYYGSSTNKSYFDTLLDESQKIVLTNDTEEMKKAVPESLEKWTITMSPGEIRLLDPRISSEEIVLKDPNIAFRSFMMASSKFKDELILYNIGMHFEVPEDSSREAKAVITVHRAVAPSKQAFFHGTFISFGMIRHEVLVEKKSSSWFWPW
jgi:hypothetical protein